MVDLGTKVGPFPVGGWLAIAGAGAGLGILLNRSSLFDGSSAPDDVPLVVDEEVPTFAGDGYGPTGPVALPTYVGTAPPPQTVDVRPTTNEEWASLVITLLITNHGITPSVADTAIRNYLAGTPLSQTERTVVDRALASKFGVPPGGAPPIVMATAPTQSLGNIPTPPGAVDPDQLGRRIAQVKSTRNSQTGGTRGETPIELAMRLYGTTEWQWIAKFNPSIKYRAGGGSVPLRAGMSILY